jgi:predicted GIY-YIG superfamily endonuclease
MSEWCSPDVGDRVSCPWANITPRGNGRGGLPVALAYVEPCESLSAALKRERELKPWSRAKKEALIADR